MNIDTQAMAIRAEQSLQATRLNRAWLAYDLQATPPMEAVDTMPRQATVRSWIARLAHSLHVSLAPARREPGAI